MATAALRGDDPVLRRQVVAQLVGEGGRKKAPRPMRPDDSDRLHISRMIARSHGGIGTKNPSKQ